MKKTQLIELCSRCDGTGICGHELRTSSHEFETHYAVCHHCGGTGRIVKTIIADEAPFVSALKAHPPLAETLSPCAFNSVPSPLRDQVGDKEVVAL